MSAKWLIKSFGLPKKAFLKCCVNVVMQLKKINSTLARFRLKM